MASLTDATKVLATDAQADANLPGLSAGTDALATDAAALASGFGTLQANMNALPLRWTALCRR